MFFDFKDILQHFKFVNWRIRFFDITSVFFVSKEPVSFPFLNSIKNFYLAEKQKQRKILGKNRRLVVSHSWKLVIGYLSIISNLWYIKLNLGAFGHFKFSITSCKQDTKDYGRPMNMSAIIQTILKYLCKICTKQLIFTHSTFLSLCLSGCQGA